MHTKKNQSTYKNKVEKKNEKDFEYFFSSFSTLFLYIPWTKTTSTNFKATLIVHLYQFWHLILMTLGRWYLCHFSAQTQH